MKFNCGEPNDSNGEDVADFSFVNGRFQLNDIPKADQHKRAFVCSKDFCANIDNMLDSCSSNFASAQSVIDLDTKITNLVNDLNNVSTDNATPSLLFGIDKDSLIVGLLLINILVMVISIVICYSSQKTKRYAPVKAIYSSEEEQESIRLK